MATAEPRPFAVVLSRYRVAAGLTQEELAERAGLSAEAIGTLERGVVRRPRPSTVRQLLDALQLSADDRASFEQAARTAGVTAPVGDAPPVGNFLGARPATAIVGRGEELARIRSILDTVSEGAGQLLLLSGEIGVGKTRLLQELTLEARSRGYLVVTGRCYATGQTSPFSAVVEALADAHPTVPAASRSDWQRGWKRIGSLLAAADGANTGAILTRREVVGAVSDLLMAVARAVPVAFLLDDLHRADGESLTLVAHLARSTRAAPLLLAGAFLDHRLTEDHPALAGTLRVLARERLAERLGVRRLSLDETTQLVALTMGEGGVSEEFAHFVYRRTKGVPRLIDGLIRSMGGRLQLQGEIGAGAMGRVFRAFDRILETTVAAKLVLARREIDLETLLRFQQEGAVLATLEHPNIVAIYDSFAEEHASCIIMELLEGQSLGQILRDGPLPLPRAKELALQVAAALGYAHSQEIVHRDIKPDNVMVLEGDRVKVTDFGIARILRPDTSLSTMATTGMRMGTPLYMAPEQIEGERIDGRTDIYALGAMLYHMVIGRPPFGGGDALTVAIKHLREDPVPPSSIDPSIPADWDGVILRALAKDPRQRFQSAAEMHEAIGALGTGVSGTRAPGGFWAPIRRGQASRHLSVALAAAATVVLALLVIAGGSSPFPSRTPALPRSRAVASLGAPRPWGRTLDDRGALSAPAAVTVDRQGNVYVANAGNNTVDKFTPSGALLARWGGPGSSVRFDAPSSLAVDRQGHVFVVNDGGRHPVQELSPAGTVLSVLTPAASSGIRGGFVAVDPGGTVYLFDPSVGGGIVAYTPGPDGIVDWAAGPSRAGYFAGTAASLIDWAGRKLAGIPSGFGVDGRGNVYVADSETGDITELGSHGWVIRRWRLRELAEAAGGPEALAVDADGTVYVADSKDSRILKLSSDGTLAASWGRAGAEGTRFLHPSGVAVDARGNVYATNRGSDEIVELSSRGRPLATWGTPTLRPARLDNPRGAAVDGRGDVLVVTGSSDDHIETFAPSGQLLADWGPTSGRTAGSRVARAFGSLAVDGHGDVYAADMIHNRLLELSSRGRLLAEWGVQVGAISGVAVDQRGNVYVGDSSTGRVLKLSGSGEVLARWATGPFTAPQHLAVDGQGTMYVTYTGENLVQKFSPTGKLVLEWGGSGRGQLVDTEDVAVDRQGTVYVVDDAAGHVVAFSSRGDLRGVWGSVGSRPGQFSNPSGVAVDARGNVYVTDTGNHRIQRLALGSGGRPSH